MTQKDLEHLSKDEIQDILIQLINDMKIKGDYFMNYYNESKDKDFDIDKYACGAVLLTFVNRTNTIIKKLIK